MRSLRSSIEKLRQHWRDYLIQSIIATCAIFLVILLLQSFNMVIVASTGASTFVVFAMPKHITARSRNVIGGHIVGLAAGSVFGLIPANTMI